MLNDTPILTHNGTFNHLIDVRISRIYGYHCFVPYDKNVRDALHDCVSQKAALSMSCLTKSANDAQCTLRAAIDRCACCKLQHLSSVRPCISLSTFQWTKSKTQWRFIHTGSGDVSPRSVPQCNATHTATHVDRVNESLLHSRRVPTVDHAHCVSEEYKTLNFRS